MSGAIGVFDSGIGGLTVAAAIKRHLPQQQILYFGDTLHLPYGDKSSESIKKYIKAISAFLYESDCAHLVVACNSASSVLPQINDLPNFQSVINVIDPVVDRVLKSTDLKRIGVIGTKRTINSHIYKTQLLQANKGLEVFELSTPLLAPMIEEGFAHDAIAEQVIHEYLSELPDIDGLILGCTHYPLIRKEIDAFYDRKVQLFDAPDLVAETLVKHVSPTQPSVADHFFVSDLTESFKKTAQLFFGDLIELEKRVLFQY
ncbi:MAG: glutamate racemase [Bacteroidia bacterium]|jgi:glutamate racemase